MKRIILFLNENPLPAIFTRGTISGKELRLRAALKEIDEVHVIARRGQPVASHHRDQTPLEEKIIIHRLPSWPYYLSTLPLLIGGFILTKRLSPLTIEAESPILSGPAAVILGWWFKLPAIIEVRASYDQLIRFRLRLLPLHFKKWLLNLVLLFSYRRASVIIANSQMYAERLHKLGFEAVIINPGLQYLPPSLRLCFAQCLYEAEQVFAVLK